MPDTLELPQTAPQPATPQPQQQQPKRGKMTVINLEKVRSTVLFSIYFRQNMKLALQS
jgi:hypothetical protein